MRIVSKNGNLMLGLKSGEIVKFTNMNGAGVFETEDKEIIKELKSMKYYGASGTNISFASGDIPTAQSNNVVQGARGSRVDEVDIKALYKEFDALKTKIVKVDGTYRADAEDKDITKFEELKKELDL